MEPIAIATRDDGEWSLIHRCQDCDVIKSNRIAGDDDIVALICLALRPLTRLPVPLESVPLLVMSTYRDSPKGEQDD